MRWQDTRAAQVAKAQGRPMDVPCPRQVVDAAVEQTREAYWQRFRRELHPDEVDTVRRGVELRWRPEGGTELPSDTYALAEAMHRADPLAPRWIPGIDELRGDARPPWVPDPNAGMGGPRTGYSMQLNGRAVISDPVIDASRARAEAEMAAARAEQHEKWVNGPPVLRTVGPPT